MRGYICKFGLVVIVGFLLLSCYGAKTFGEESKEAAKSWRRIGPGGGGGVFYPTINPANPKHIFACCDMTGAYVTYDGGLSWRMFNLQTGIRDFEFAPGEPKTVYASTNGSLHSEDRGKLNSGLYRSDDKGVRWRLVYPSPEQVKKEGWLNGTVNRILVDPGKSGRVFIGINPLSAFISRGAQRRSRIKAKVMVSSDRGESFKELAQLEGRSIVAILPGDWWGNPRELIVFTEQGGFRVLKDSGRTIKLSLSAGRISAADGGRGPNGGILYVLTGMQRVGDKIVGGVLRSKDGGMSWQQVNPELPGWANQERLPSFRTIGVCLNRPEVIYLACNASRSEYGTLKSNSAGDGWIWVYHANDGRVVSNNLKESWLGRNYGPGWGGTPISLGVAPGDPDICYASDGGRAYRTLDGGKSWEQIYSDEYPDGSVGTRGLDVTTCYGVHFDPFDEEHFFISYTDIGLFHTFNGGKSWFHSIKGVPGGWVNTCYWAAFDPEVKGRVWSVWGNAHDLPRTKMFSRRGFDGYVGGVAVSDDGGKSWRRCTKGMPDNSIGTHILVDPDSPADSRTLYACVFDKGVYKSTDGGQSWKRANKGLGANKFAWQMRRLANGRLYLIVSRGELKDGKQIGGGLYMSDDGAETWQKASMPERVNAPADLLVDPMDEETMYLSCWPRTVRGKDVYGGLYRTKDGGKSWKQVFKEDVRVSSAGMDGRWPETIYINTFHNSAFRSDDRGDTWSRLEGYNFKWGQRAFPDPHHPGMLYLTTYGGSVFYGPAGGVPGAFEDIENYPGR